jgi:hypothetical protein
MFNKDKFHNERRKKLYFKRIKTFINVLHDCSFAGEMEDKRCKYCKRAFMGRVDKIFCTTHCRTAHHNEKSRIHQKKKVYKLLIDQIENNRKILKALSDASDLNLNMLTALGFSYEVYSHKVINKKGIEFRYSVDYGIGIIDQKLVIRDSK